MVLSSTELRVLETLDQEGMLEFVSRLVKIPSVGGSETPAQEMVATWMEENGFQVDRWELDLEKLRRHPAHSEEVERREGLGVVGILGESGSGRDLILNGHVDVVPLGDEGRWTVDPWGGELSGGRIWGRGSLDMKGGLACGLFAAKAVLDSGVRLKGRVLLESVVGEEDGGVGTLATIQRGYRAHGAVIMEPTAMAVCPVQAGSLNFRIRLRGKAAHGCIRDEGVSVLEKWETVSRELVALEHSRNHLCSDPVFGGYGLPFPLSVGTMRAGDWPSSVPSILVAEGRYGLFPEEGPEEARAAFQEALDRAVARDEWLSLNPPEVEWWGGRFLGARTPLDDPVVTTLVEAAGDGSGMAPPVEGVPFGSDLRLLVLEGGVPTALFGPGDIRQAHSIDESVAVDELKKTLRTLALMILRFCGHGDG